ncbi:DMT family transporter [Burkholderia cenocepacia]|uniref:DMT family transporter n=1 Tax=Burkholderia cenocepacia TaxID=95486 RepID=UPI001365942A|nr:DMT family transporter [Burkholderia cenocepacia]
MNSTLHNKPLRAGALALGSALCFALSALTFRLSVSSQVATGMPALLLAFSAERIMGFVLLLAIWGWPRMALWKGNAVIGGLISSGSLAYYFALSTAALGVATTLCDSYNLLAVLLAAVIARRLPSKSKLLALVLAFAGAAICARPTPHASSTLGATAAALSAVVFALALLGQRHQASRGARTQDILGWMYICSVVPLTGYLIYARPSMPGWHAVIYSAMTALLTLAANYLSVQAQRYGSLLQVGSLVYMTGVFSTALAWVLLNERMDLLTLAGVSCVIAGGVGSTVLEQRALRGARTRTGATRVPSESLAG